MEIIPVIDLKGGVVVRARMGQRDQYRPIETPLSPTSDPVDVVRGLLSVSALRTLYVADLDAIERKGDARAALARVGSAAGPDLERLAAIRQLSGRRLVYAAGGLRHAGDLDELKNAGITGVLVASALHDGRLTRADIEAP